MQDNGNEDSHIYINRKPGLRSNTENQDRLEDFSD